MEIISFKYAFLGLICLFAFVCGLCLARAMCERRARNKNRRAAIAAGGAGDAAHIDSFSCDGLASKILSYMRTLEVRIAHKQTQCITLRLRTYASGRAGAQGVSAGGVSVGEVGGVRGSLSSAGVGGGTSALGRKNKQDVNILRAGLKDKISANTIREARLRLGVGLGLVGCMAGVCLSNELAMIMGTFGLLCGAFSPTWAVSQEVKARSNQLKIELPEMLEVVSLGMSSGLSFDRSFGLYYAYFDTVFSRACANAHKRWTMGFSSREEALNDLSNQYESATLRRIVQNIERSMKFGTTLSDDLKRAAEDSREEQKAATQEHVAKVPVRMMIPTACLILPAMLILVLGPVLLELIGGFS